ncbi:SCO6745 family protein [Nocardia sp. NBC_01388]|uniref:SCO6745 family protein n=1 Tax=Nocardia sp. NBC_01388 TaxID=2903596 RepID=UPI003253C8EE
MSVASAVKDQVQQIGGGFMFSREAKEFSASTGVEGFMPGYTRGRGGVLGDVDADVVTAAFGFFRAEAIRAAWESTAAVPAAKGAAGYLAACQDFGRRKLADFAQAERLAELLQPVVDAADPAGAPLFAGWRALPRADDAPGRVLQLIHVLRELRGGLHLIGVRASGLTPQQAVLIAGSPRTTGPEQARAFGWPEPFEEITAELKGRWMQAETITEDLIGPSFAVLDASAAQELIELLTACQATVFARR